MRQLRFVRAAEDGHHLLLEDVDAAGEQFVLSRDAALLDAIRGERPVPAQHVPAQQVAARPMPPAPAASDPPVAADPPIAPGVAAPAPTEAPAAPPAALPAAPPAAPRVEVSPREIQMRVRAGESPQQAAEALGVPLERILRFATPVVEERLRIADEARRARARRTGAEGSDGVPVIFGETVDARYAAHGVDVTTVAWDAYRRDDGDWVVLATWPGDAGPHDARWLFRRSSRSVTALDDAAADLLSDRPIRPVTPPRTEPGRPSLVAAPPLLHGVVAFPPMAEASTGRLPRVLPRVEDVFDQETDRHPSHAGARVEVRVDVELEPDSDAPPLPLGIHDPAARTLASLPRVHSARRDESDDERAARVKVPSWDDILLGVRRKQD